MLGQLAVGFVHAFCSSRLIGSQSLRDESRNVWWLGLLTLGEGWHNNHHARPAAAVHGWRWYQIDISGYAIRLMARLGVIRNVVREPQI